MAAGQFRVGSHSYFTQFLNIPLPPNAGFELRKGFVTLNLTASPNRPYPRPAISAAPAPATNSQGAVHARSAERTPHAALAGPQDGLRDALPRPPRADRTARLRAERRRPGRRPPPVPRPAVLADDLPARLRAGVGPAAGATPRLHALAGPAPLRTPDQHSGYHRRARVAGRARRP